MKVLSGISVLALLIAGAATPSFATSLTPCNVVTPGIVSANGSILASTGVTSFNFGGDTGSGEEFVGFLVAHRTADDDIITLLPIRRRRHLVLRRQLHRIEHTQNLVEIAARRHRVREMKLDALIRSNDEHGADRSIVCGGAALAAVACIAGKHVVQLRNLKLRVADHG